jgi:pilus assembly protein CpaB
MIKNQALGGRSNKALIFLGLFLGAVSAVLVIVYLSQASDDGGGSVSGGVATPVVVASTDIPVGTRITEDMLSLKPISSDAVLTTAYGDIGDVTGQVTKVPLVSGEQVIPTKVTATGAAIAGVEDPRLAYVVPEGKRAVSVEVSSIIGASGLIRPGDYVDVLLTIKVESEEGKDQLAKTILQNAQVLTIGEEVNRTVVAEGEASGTLSSDDDSEANPDATTVTLAVSPVHGEVLTVAETCGSNFGGRLALALRAFGDSGQVATRSAWAEDGVPPTCAALMGLSSLQ